MSAERERQRLVFLAELAEQAGRYGDVVDCIISVAKLDLELSPDGRNLLSIGIKKVIGSQRTSWRIISSEEQKEESRGDGNLSNLAKEYRLKVEGEITKLCNDIRSIADTHMQLHGVLDNGGEAAVFYYKIRGDCFSYLADLKTDRGSRGPDIAQSLRDYKAAFDTARADLPPSHPLRLESAMDYTFLFYEEKPFPTEAVRIAKEAFDEAAAELDTLNEESHKDSTQIMQLFSEKIAVMTSGVEVLKSVVEELRQKYKQSEEKLRIWDQLQIRLVSYFKSSCSTVQDLLMIHERANYDFLRSEEDMKKTVERLMIFLLSDLYDLMNETMVEFAKVVRYPEHLVISSKQLVLVEFPEDSIKRHQNIDCTLIDACLSGLEDIYEHYRLEYDLKVKVLAEYIREVQTLHVFRRNSRLHAILIPLKWLLLLQPNLSPPDFYVNHVYDVAFGTTDYDVKALERTSYPFH